MSEKVVKEYIIRQDLVQDVVNVITQSVHPKYPFEIIQKVLMSVTQLPEYKEVPND
jgi:hypothetical protein